MAKEKELKAKISLKDNFSKNADKVARKTQKIIEKEKKLQKRHRKLGLVLGKPIKVIFKFDKKIFKQLDKVKSKFNSIKSSLKGFRKNIVIKVKSSTAFVALKKIKSNLIALKKLRAVKLLVNLKDKASGRMKKILSNVKSISGKVFRFTVRAKDATKKVLGGIKGALGALAKGLVIPITVATVGLKGLAQEENQKITINRVLQNSGKTKSQAKKSTDQYYKYLEDYANKTPFTTSEVAQFGTKSAIIAKGDIAQAKKLTDAQANVKAFVGDLRTSTEVSEAFFSASNGNLEMLNNMLGEKYETFGEALAGIQKKQGGLVDEMSGTVGGLFSTIVGKAQVGMKKFNEVFKEPLKNAMRNISTFMDTVTEVSIGFGQRLMAIDWGAMFASFDASSITNALQPIVNLFNDFFNGMETKSPVVMGIMQVLGTIFNTVWNGIGIVIKAVEPIIREIFKFIGENGKEISNIIKGLGAIWEGVWTVLGGILKVAWNGIKPILKALIDALSKVADMVQKVGNWWKSMADKIKNNPIVATVTKVFSGGEGGTSKSKSKGKSKKGKRSAFGTARVVGNDIPFRLHDGNSFAVSYSNVA